jgi:hypothetical protein
MNKIGIDHGEKVPYTFLSFTPTGQELMQLKQKYWNPMKLAW